MKRQLILFWVTSIAFVASMASPINQNVVMTSDNFSPLQATNDAPLTPERSTICIFDSVTYSHQRKARRLGSKVREWTDTDYNVIYEYNPDDGTACVKAGIQHRNDFYFDYSDPWNPYEEHGSAGSPAASGHIVVRSSITVDGKTFSVESIGRNAFAYNSQITSVDIEEGVKIIEMNAFLFCTGITSIGLPNTIDTISTSPFAHCEQLRSLHIPGSVSYISRSILPFCKNLESLTVAEDNIYYDSRDNCQAIIETATNTLIAGTLRTIIPENVSTIGSRAFLGRSLLKNIYIPSSVNAIGPVAFGVCENLESIDIPEQVTKIDSATFCVCKSLQSISIPDKVSSIEEVAFSYCESLKTLALPATVKGIGSTAFNHCTSLETINIPEGITKIEDFTFDHCESLKTLALPATVKGIGSSAFSHNTSLETINIPEGITKIEDFTFNHCESLKTLDLPATVKGIGRTAFQYCTSLETINIPEGVDSIGSWGFYGCGFESIELPASLRKIGRNAFGNCNRLIAIDIPEGVETIEQYTFYDCSSLREVTIPSTIKSIGNWAFYNCSSLETVNSYIEEVFPFHSEAFNFIEGNAVFSPHATLYVPFDTKLRYESTEGWNVFNNIIEFFQVGVSVNLSVLDDIGNKLTSGYTVNWYDSDGSPIATGTTINGIARETQLSYSIELNSILGRIYREVYKKEIECDGSPIICQLERIKELTLHGKVRAQGLEIAKADVSLAQWLNGRYEYTATTRTDANGEFTLAGYNDTTELVVSYHGYVDAKIVRRTLGDSGELGSIELQPVTGKVIDLALSYQEAARAGEEPVVMNWYADTRNIAYAVSNLTKGTDVTDFTVQQGCIVLPAGTDNGDQLRVALRSLNGKFADVSVETTVAPNDTARAEVRLMARGGVDVTVGSRADETLLVMLYDSTGKLAAHTTLAASRVTFADLQEGHYSLVSMGYSNAVGVIGNMSDLDMIGLDEGSDYVMTDVSVENGVIGRVAVGDVPGLDISKFEMTSANTSYLPNKTEMIAGNGFLTLTARVDFKTQYANEVSDVRLVVDIPDGCDFVANSVVTGTKALPHTVNGNVLTITLSPEDIESRIHFCVVPTKSGAYVTSARTTFNYRGEKTQNVGTLAFTATAGSIKVPSNSAYPFITVKGIAAPHAEVDIYDNDHLVGTTTSLGNGHWSTEVELYKPYNLSSHGIYARTTNANGYKETTETQECFYEKAAVEAKSVTMSFYNGWLGRNIDLTFDFETGKNSSNSYMFFTTTDITFIADLTANDSINVRGVTFHVFTTSDQVRTLKGFFDGKLSRWVAVDKFNSYNLPKNVSVSVDAVSGATPLLSAEPVKEWDDGLDGMQKDVQGSMSAISTMLEDLIAATEEENPDMERVSEMVASLCSTLGVVRDYDGVVDVSSPETVQRQLDEILSALDNKVFDAVEAIDTLTFMELLSYDNLTEGISLTDCNGLDAEALLADGYEMIALDNQTCVFVRQTQTAYEYVNLDRNRHLIINMGSEAALVKMAAPLGINIEAVAQGVRALVQRREEFYNMLKQVNNAVDAFKGALETANTIASNKFLQALRTYVAYVEAKSEGRQLPMAGVIMRNFKNASMKWGRLMEGTRKLNDWLQNSKAAQICGKVTSAFNILSAVDQEINNLNQVIDAYYRIPDPEICPNAREQASALMRNAVTLGVEAFSFYSLNMLSDLVAAKTAATSAAALPATGGASAVPLLLALGKIGLHSSLDAAYNWGFRQSLANIQRETRSLKCKKEKEEEEEEEEKTPPTTGTDDVIPIQDPSGFVYEAVPTNRIEGVTATIYEQTQGTTPWDAADFSQVNPQVTDETGLYRWDVPQGLWQVRFEKSGYETTQTEWLPVPPPQLEINVPMMQAVAPQVVRARGTESGITLDFSKYMKPSMLEEAGRITATANGSSVSGSVEMLNTETDPYSGKEYASRVKFVPTTAFRTSDEVTITVKKEVESYADKHMDADYVATVRIDSEIEGLVCDSLIAVDYQGSYVLDICGTPAAAVRGRTLSIATTSSMIAATDGQSATFDDNGKANITVNGNLPGSASLHLQIDDTDVEKNVDVNVVLHESMVRAPKASKRGGSTIEAGYLLWLTSSTPGATIYYTLDGSCPCDEAHRMKYTEPFALPAGQVTLKAIAVRQGMEESDVATFTYTVEGISTGVEETDAAPRLEARLIGGVLTIVGAEGCTLRVYDVAGRELATYRNAKPIVSLRMPQTECIVSATTADGQTVVKKVMRR